MEVSESELKDKFVQVILSDYGIWLRSQLDMHIVEKNLIREMKLKGSLDTKVSKVGGNWRLELFFTTYGRVIEINFHKKKAGTREIIKQLYGVKSRNDILAARAKRDKKDTRWYSHTVYGSLNTLYGHLSYSFTEEMKNKLVTIIKESNI